MSACPRGGQKWPGAGIALSNLVRHRLRIMSEEPHQRSRLQPRKRQGPTEVAGRDAAAPATARTAVLGLKPSTRVAPPDHALIGRRCCPAHACRDSAVVCGRVELTVAADSRLGLTPRERRSFTVRFLDSPEPALRTELTTLVSRRGAAARRAAERMQPIEIVFDDPLRGLQRIAGWVQPPQRRNGDLHEIQFGLRAAPAP